jgi:hypothetical protein
MRPFAKIFRVLVKSLGTSLRWHDKAKAKTSAAELARAYHHKNPLR